MAPGRSALLATSRFSTTPTRPRGRRPARRRFEARGRHALAPDRCGNAMPSLWTAVLITPGRSPNPCITPAWIDTPPRGFEVEHLTLVYTARPGTLEPRSGGQSVHSRTSRTRCVAGLLKSLGRSGRGPNGRQNDPITHPNDSHKIYYGTHLNTNLMPTLTQIRGQTRPQKCDQRTRQLTRIAPGPASRPAALCPG